MEENNQLKLLAKMATDNLKALEKFKKGILSSIKKLKTTGEKINFIKKALINLKKQGIIKGAEFTGFKKGI